MYESQSPTGRCLPLPSTGHCLFRHGFMASSTSLTALLQMLSSVAARTLGRYCPWLNMLCPLRGLSFRPPLCSLNEKGIFAVQVVLVLSFQCVLREHGAILKLLLLYPLHSSVRAIFILLQFIFLSSNLGLDTWPLQS